MSQDHLQDQPEEPGWLKVLRNKAKAHDRDVPRLQKDLAVLRGNIDEDAPHFAIWERDYSNRVKAGEASWDPTQVKADAERYGLIREAAQDFSVDAATQARIEAASSDAIHIDPKTSARQRMAEARSLDDFMAAARSAGIATVED
jgi:hypothetical protein